MPARADGQALKTSEYPALFVTLFKAAMQILKGEQLRVESGGKEQVTQLQAEFLRYAYNQAPFDSQYWDADTKPLEYWTRLANDSNAKQISVCDPSRNVTPDINTYPADCCQGLLDYAVRDL
jgi:hypothetical protein